MVNIAICGNLKGIICKHDRGGRVKSGRRTTKVEEKEEQTTNRPLEVPRLDKARRGEMAMHSCNN